MARTSSGWPRKPSGAARPSSTPSRPVVVPIDFSFSGFGYCLFDLGISLGSLKAGQRPALLDGYGAARPLSDADLGLLGAFFLQGIVGSFGFHIYDQPHHEWIARRLPEVARSYCTAFLEGRKVIPGVDR